MVEINPNIDVQNINSGDITKLPSGYLSSNPYGQDLAQVGWSETVDPRMQTLPKDTTLLTDEDRAKMANMNAYTINGNIFRDGTKLGSLEDLRANNLAQLKTTGLNAGVMSSEMPTLATMMPTKTEAEIQAEIDKQTEAGKSAIRSQYDQQMRNAINQGQKEIGGAQSQLGATRGLGYSSSRVQFVKELENQNAQFIRQLENDRDAALSKLDFDQAEKSASQIDKMREYQFKLRTQAFDEAQKMLDLQKTQADLNAPVAINGITYTLDKTTGQYTEAPGASTEEGKPFALGNTIWQMGADGQYEKIGNLEGKAQFIAGTAKQPAGIFDPDTQTFTPLRGGAVSGGGGGTTSGTTPGQVYNAQTGKQEAIDFTDRAQVNALPISEITKSIILGYGTAKTLTPTMQAEVAKELFRVGYDPVTPIFNKLDQLKPLWEAVPSSMTGVGGYISGLAGHYVPEIKEFNSAATVLTRLIARLNDVGMLSDQDVASYQAAMPSLKDATPEVVQKAIDGLKKSITNKAQTYEQKATGTSSSNSSVPATAQSSGDILKQYGITP